MDALDAFLERCRVFSAMVLLHVSSSAGAMAVVVPSTDAGMGRRMGLGWWLWLSCSSSSLRSLSKESSSLHTVASWSSWEKNSCSDQESDWWLTVLDRPSLSWLLLLLL